MGLTPTPTNAEVLERVELYLYSPKGPSWPVQRVKHTYLSHDASSKDKEYEEYKSAIFPSSRNMTPCRLTYTYRRFGRST